MRYCGSEWKIRVKLKPGEKGTIREYTEHGDDLVCIRYRCNDNGVRIKTVELVVSKAVNRKE